MEDVSIADRIEQLRDRAEYAKTHAGYMVTMFLAGAAMEAGDLTSTATVTPSAGAILIVGACAMAVGTFRGTKNVLDSVQTNHELAALVTVQAQQADATQAQ